MGHQVTFFLSPSLPVSARLSLPSFLSVFVSYHITQPSKELEDLMSFSLQYEA